jgi:hypothetical protein
VNPTLFEFFAWKASDLKIVDAGEISDSGKVRVYELKNIVSRMLNDPIVALFGKGFGGSYNFKDYPLPVTERLDLKSYSQEELNREIYYNSHSFLASTLLKYGVIGLFIYLMIPIVTAIKSKFDSRQTKLHTMIGVLSILLIYNYYWRIELMILMGMFFGMAQSSRGHDLAVENSNTLKLDSFNAQPNNTGAQSTCLEVKNVSGYGLYSLC